MIHEALDIGFGLFIGTLIGFFFGLWVVGSGFQEDAVRHGHAEYYLDDKFDKKWRWKP